MNSHHDKWQRTEAEKARKLAAKQTKARQRARQIDPKQMREWRASPNPYDCSGSALKEYPGE